MATQVMPDAVVVYCFESRHSKSDQHYLRYLEYGITNSGWAIHKKNDRKRRNSDEWVICDLRPGVLPVEVVPVELEVHVGSIRIGELLPML